MRRPERKRQQQDPRDRRTTDRQNKDFFEDAAKDIAALEEHKLHQKRRALIQVRKKTPVHLTDNHRKYQELLRTKDVILGMGVAGTGKTYMAVEVGVAKLNAGEISRLIITRPAKEAGEKLGFLPGNMKEKLDPYLVPIYDALKDLLDPDNWGHSVSLLEHHLKTGVIEIVPVGFMRGRTLSDAFIICDEIQNCTYNQMRMLLTRIGHNSQMVMAGDESQHDDVGKGPSPLRRIAALISNSSKVGTVVFEEKDVLRSGVTAQMATLVPEDKSEEDHQPNNVFLQQSLLLMAQGVNKLAEGFSQAQTTNNDKIDKLATAVAGLVATMQMSQQLQQVEQVQTLIEKAAAALTKPGTKKHKDGRAPNKGSRPKQDRKVLPFQAVSHHGRKLSF